MIDLPSLGVLYSESVLSLYPLLVKQLKTSLESQVFQRCVVYSMLALVIGGIGAVRGMFTGVGDLGLFIALGLVNLAHVWTSYRAFQKLPSGAALTLFYTYPILNIVGAWLFFGERIGAKTIPFFLMIMMGVYLLITAKGEAKIAPSAGGGEGFKDKKVQMDIKDILAGLGAAVTETAIYLLLYSRRAEKNVNMFTSVLRVYGSTALLMLPAALLGKFDFIPGESRLMGLWNSLLGFTGYSARFAAIPLVSPVLYSALSLFGIFAGYIWGFLFGKERMSLRGLSGSALVGIGIFLLKMM